jgi:hypothetical protein
MATYVQGSKFNRLLKNHSESFDGLRTNGMGTELTAENPFMLSVSKHVPAFSTVCQSRNGSKYVEPFDRLRADFL